MCAARRIDRVVKSVWQSEGRGARVRRSIGRPELKNLDPFLLLDEFEVDGKTGAGFPDHPHRGFETVTYMMKGEFTHEDFLGNQGILRPGDIQWMTAGRGIVHSEMPRPMHTHGMQLWVNLKISEKMVEPQYQELNKDEIKQAREGGVSVNIIAGESMGVSSPVITRTPSYYLDFTVAPASQYSQPIPAHWTAFAYTLHGKIVFGDDGAQEPTSPHHTVVFEASNPEANHVLFRNGSQEEARFVLIAGQPLGEPVFQQGPFVLGSAEALEQTFEDYHMGKNGFERAPGWKSRHGK